MRVDEPLDGGCCPSTPAPARTTRTSSLSTPLNDKYVIDRLLGEGGMASVYAGSHRNGNRVAIKLLHAELSSHADTKQRFLREGYIANAVGHAGVVRVLDDDVARDGRAFLVMELLAGETLSGRAERLGGCLDPIEVLQIADQVLSTLDAAHAKGILHRDIKPDNLFLTADGQVKLLDFGIARMRDGSGTATRTGTMMGTPAFMPPEQALGRTSLFDARTDLWSFGATMFTLLTGHFVHVGQTGNEHLVLAATSRARPVSQLRPDIPPQICQVVDRALAFEQESRFADALAMQAAVRDAYAVIHGGSPTTSTLRGEHDTLRTDAPAVLAASPPVVSARPRRSRAPMIAGLVVTLSVGLAAALAVGAANQRKPPTSVSSAAPSVTTQASSAAPSAAPGPAPSPPSTSAAAPSPPSTSAPSPKKTQPQPQTGPKPIDMDRRY